MIKLLFEKNTQFFFIIIENKRVYYLDKLQGEIWGGPLQYLPPDPAVIKKIDMSRNKIPAYFKAMLVVTPDELAEYESAQSDKELREIVLKDTKKWGCKLVKETTQ